MGIIIYIIIGIISGWLAGELVEGGGFGLIGNLVVGLIGSVIGGMLMDFIGEGRVSEKSGFIVSIIISTLGAIILLLVLNAIF